MSTSTTSSNCFTLVENWDTETLIIFLCDLDINLDEDDFKILREQKIDGQTFPDMTERKFMKDGIKRGPAMKLEKQAKIFKEGTRAFGKGKIEYFWLFPCDKWSLQHFISWSTNMFGLTERNEAHTVFYNTLYIFRDDPMASQEIHEVIRNLLLKKKVCVFYFAGTNTHFFRYDILGTRSFRLGIYKPSVIAVLYHIHSD